MIKKKLINKNQKVAIKVKIKHPLIIEIPQLNIIIVKWKLYKKNNNKNHQIYC